jgi:hypothetical protein
MTHPPGRTGRRVRLSWHAFVVEAGQDADAKDVLET